MRALKTFFVGAWSLVAGLSVTLRYLFKHRVTVQYPYETLTMSPAYRGRIQLIVDEETGWHRCLACLQCSEICPSSCITVVDERDPETRKKRPVEFELRFELCSLCGLCTEVCATDALEYSREYQTVSHDRRDLVFDLLAPFAGRSAPKAAPEGQCDEDDEEQDTAQAE